MGRGSRSSEVSVKKERQESSQAKGSGTGGSSRNESSGDSCLFSFEAHILIPSDDSKGIEKASTVVIVPHHSDPNRLDLFIGGKDFGSYNGSHAKRMLACIKKNYLYDGTVQALSKVHDNVKIEFLIQGRGR
ncbi:MAG: hypothetical protein Q8P26_03390 [Candidatus Levybacteria bacterium]|nr:hypothetical protein [Candidatus Levybacteria bacterium]